MSVSLMNIIIVKTHRIEGNKINALHGLAIELGNFFRGMSKAFINPIIDGGIVKIGTDVIEIINIFATIIGKHENR